MGKYDVPPPSPTPLTMVTHYVLPMMALCEELKGVRTDRTVMCHHL